MKYIISLLTIFMFLPGLYSQEIENGSLKITGKAKMLLVPDIVTISFRFNVRDKSSSSAQNTLVEESNKLIDRLNKLGYDNNEIKLLALSIDEDWDYGGERAKMTGFLASNKIELSIKYDPIKTSQLIDSIRVSNFKYLEYSFNLEISESLKNSSRDFLIKTAIENAKHSADLIAQSTNISLDGITNIEYQDLVFNIDSNDNVPPPPPIKESSQTYESLRFENIVLKELEVYEEVIIHWRIKKLR